MLILTVGDIHFPYRETSIPVQFKKFLIPGRIQHILCTGNLCTRGMTEILKTICSDLHVVRGDFDYLVSSTASPARSGSSSASNVPEQKVITIDGLKIGLCHGHQIVPWNDKNALRMLAQQLDVDVLVSGHSHRYHVFEADRRLFINPGSLTGAFGYGNKNIYGRDDSDINVIGEDEAGVPSFVLLDVDSSEINVYAYTIVNGEVDVQKSTVKRP